MAFGPYVVEFRLVQEELGIRGGGAQQKKAHPFVYELVHIGMYRQYTPSPASGGSFPSRGRGRARAMDRAISH